MQGRGARTGKSMDNFTMRNGKMDLDDEEYEEDRGDSYGIVDDAEEASADEYHLDYRGDASKAPI
ncbi:uncharacterized protein G2W53_023779 [Senna tora]|uniref:Uncharacterized protein n=1 Tax=Senna tora TaxID=362788 RepID=A0A834TIX9_9FABA|nr:uncharacterized protein G2W53_023779 [Senna tora]